MSSPTFGKYNVRIRSCWNLRVTDFGRPWGRHHRKTAAQRDFLRGLFVRTWVRIGQSRGFCLTSYKLDSMYTWIKPHKAKCHLLEHQVLHHYMFSASCLHLFWVFKDRRLVSTGIDVLNICFHSMWTLLAQTGRPIKRMYMPDPVNA